MELCSPQSYIEGPIPIVLLLLLWYVPLSFHHLIIVQLAPQRPAVGGKPEDEGRNGEWREMGNTIKGRDILFVGAQFQNLQIYFILQE